MHAHCIDLFLSFYPTPLPPFLLYSSSIAFKWLFCSGLALASAFTPDAQGLLSLSLLLLICTTLVSSTPHFLYCDLLYSAMKYAYVSFSPSAEFIPRALHCPLSQQRQGKRCLFAVSTALHNWFWFFHVLFGLVCYCLVLPIYFAPVLFFVSVYSRRCFFWFLVGFLVVLCGGRVVGIHARIDFGLHGLPDYPCRTYYYYAPRSTEIVCISFISLFSTSPWSLEAKVVLQSALPPCFSFLEMFFFRFSLSSSPSPPPFSTRLLNVMDLLHMPVRVIYTQFVLYCSSFLSAMQ